MNYYLLFFFTKLLMLSRSDQTHKHLWVTRGVWFGNSSLQDPLEMQPPLREVSHWVPNLSRRECYSNILFLSRP